jgi:hypothetical protein
MIGFPAQPDSAERKKKSRENVPANVTTFELRTALIGAGVVQSV